MVDSHAHLYAKEFDVDRPEMMERARAIGLTKIFMPNIDHVSIDAMLEVEMRFRDQAVPMMGLHPCSVKRDFETELGIVEHWLSKKSFAAIGEMGTDLYWDKTFWEEQKEAFRVQVGWAKKYGLPIVIHCRESIDQTIELLEPLLSKDLTGIFHCFSGNLDQAKRIISMGFYLGIGGVVTFKNGGLNNVIPEIDLNKIVLETDSPFLAPTPHRGKRNEPAYLALVAQRIADLKAVPLANVVELTTKNSEKIFRTVTSLEKS